MRNGRFAKIANPTQPTPINVPKNPTRLESGSAAGVRDGADATGSGGSGSDGGLSLGSGVAMDDAGRRSERRQSTEPTGTRSRRTASMWPESEWVGRSDQSRTSGSRLAEGQAKPSLGPEARTDTNSPDQGSVFRAAEGHGDLVHLVQPGVGLAARTGLGELVADQLERLDRVFLLARFLLCTADVHVRR